MKSRISWTFLITAIVVLAIPIAASAQTGFSLVPCGGTGHSACTFGHLILRGVRIINFLLAASAVVTMYYILTSAWLLLTALGSAEKIAAAKLGLRNAIIGFALILLSFAFINLLIQGLFGLTNCNWWTNPAQLWSNNSCLLPP